MLNKPNRELLQMALQGYQHEIAQMQDKCREITAELMGTSKVQSITQSIATAEAPGLVAKKTRRKRTAAQRAKMAKAQRARWARVKREAA